MTSEWANAGVALGTLQVAARRSQRRPRLCTASTCSGMHAPGGRDGDGKTSPVLGGRGSGRRQKATGEGRAERRGSDGGHPCPAGCRGPGHGRGARWTQGPSRSSEMTTAGRP